VEWLWVDDYRATTSSPAVRDFTMLTVLARGKLDKSPPQFARRKGISAMATSIFGADEW
jgi:hypothetical protein